MKKALNLLIFLSVIGPAWALLSSAEAAAPARKIVVFGDSFLNARRTLVLLTTRFDPSRKGD